MSTYNETMENPFSWETVIGTAHSVCDYPFTQGDDVSLSIGLLATLRGQLVNLPDSMVKEVFQDNFNPGLFLPLADHSSEKQRAAVVGVRMNSAQTDMLSSLTLSSVDS